MAEPPGTRSVSFHRNFYTMPTKPTLSEDQSVIHRPSTDSTWSQFRLIELAGSLNSSSEVTDLMAYINSNIIGKDKTFRGPFGDRKTVYCDWTASGKSLYFIEDFINSEVLPTYGNTHTTTNVTSLQTTMFRHEARDIIRNAVRASQDDAVIFVGSGCTGAIHKLIHNLNLEQPPIVVVGPFEHHSNMLPWRHLAHKVCRAKTDASGTVSLKSLENILRTESVNARELNCPLIVCMAAASNVTGIMVDVDEFTALIHRYGGLAFWDYATAAPYIKIDMNPVSTRPDGGQIYKDAIYFSMHKFVGGPQTPGVLIAKRALFKAGESQPSGCGGGTVFFVRREGQVYLKDVEEREEGGTPAIIESIRAGLVMQLKEAVTAAVIMKREEYLVQQIWARLSDCANIIILGGKEAPRLPIISLVIRHLCLASNADANVAQAPCLFLHHNFVAALLNDLFGIQSRGGCACAGPYAMDLLGIDEALAKLYEESLVSCHLEDYRHSRIFDAPNRELLRPGFVRLSIPFFYTDAEVNFILDALKFVATHGWAFLPLYGYNPATGEWIHRRHDPSRDRRWLSNVQYQEGQMSWISANLEDHIPAPKDFQACLTAAHEELEKAINEVTASTSLPVPDDTGTFADLESELRWFLLPSEAAAQIRNETNQLSVASPNSSPWHPGTLSVCFCPDLQSLEAISLNSEQANPPSDKCMCVLPCDSHPVTRLSVPLAMRHVVRPSQCGNPDPIKFVDLKVEGTPVHQNSVLAVEIAPPVNCAATVVPSPTVNVVSTQALQQSAQLVHDARLEQLTPDQLSSRNNNACLTESCPFYPRLSTKSTASRHNMVIKRKRDAQLKPPKSLWRTPPKDLYKLVVRAIREFSMIKPGDRVLVCLSGGKDSLSLLHCLRQYQRMLQSNGTQTPFELGAVTVDPGSSSYDPSPLIPYLAALDVPYHFEKQGIIRQASELPYELSSICSFCSRMKRGRIYACARTHGYNVIALGQHLDDVVESFFMSCFHNGLLLTMKANYSIRQGDLRVIRPLVFVREHQTRKFAETSSLPVIPENCPACFSAPKERFRIKRMLAEQEVLFPDLFPNLRSALMPLISEKTTRPNKNQRCLSDS